MGKEQSFKGRMDQIVGKYIHVALLIFLLKWIVLGGLVGILAGSASALFLTSLEWATSSRMNHPWLLYLLPLGGILMSYMYTRFGANSGKGNNLLIETIQGGEERVPLRMAPLVLGGTILTHWFGGSAGREGTAVQMGGSLAAWVGRVLKLDKVDTRIILMCGISSGFGSVFGTPLAGTVFALEVVMIGLLRYEALLPCFIASLVGDQVTLAWGVHHTHFQVGTVPPFSILLLAKIVIAGIVFGLVALLFSELLRLIKKLYAGWFSSPLLRTFVGGLAIIGMVFLFQSRDYLGLGIPLIQDAFSGDAGTLSFLWKLLFTVLTLGSGFLGGEVTPLFVIGSTLGASLSGLLHEPAAFLAALGFVAVFAGAANTPLACFIMGIELFGADAAVYLFIVCTIAYLFSAHTGIYTSQRLGASKSKLWLIREGETLAGIRKPK